MDKNLSFKDPNDLVDLAGYLKRALRLDSTGAVRLRAFGSVLAVYVSPIYAGSLLGDGLTVIGLRTINLTSQNELDSLFTIEDLVASVDKSIESDELALVLPKTAARVGWAGISPPRQGWVRAGEVEQEKISAWAKDGIAAVVDALPESIGSAIAARVRLQIWVKRWELNTTFQPVQPLLWLGWDSCKKVFP